MLQRIELFGRRYAIKLEGSYERTQWESSNEYTYTIETCLDWSGVGRLTDHQNKKCLVFIFEFRDYDIRANRLGLQEVVFRADRPVRHGHCQGGVIQPEVVFRLEMSVERQGVIDYLGEQLVKLLDQADKSGILPHISLPIIQLDVLTERGLLAEPEGQIRMKI